ncbi:unnamed protein product [Soboliphyme baturini]|uniref:C2H2-type domain-containing protein n=1 Tax=Soboliphyme baturini TaxID=241478 RepID=A0A183J3B2_9BILA|nr:unnamed protein product [Soboliphyme baturini]
MVSVGKEPFIFEKHVVRVNEIEGNGKDRPHSLEAAGGDADCSTCSETEDPSLTCYTELSQGGDDYEEGGAEKSKHDTDSGASSRQYLSEHEAIETPTEVVGVEWEYDPDIKSRYCSICGYHGKWISEMIRHKRVHTNERPFRCKYCSRTSKWKADLIRHYSRSKTFDGSESGSQATKDADQGSYNNGATSADELMLSEDGVGSCSLIDQTNGSHTHKRRVLHNRGTSVASEESAIAKTINDVVVKTESGMFTVKNEDRLMVSSGPVAGMTPMADGRLSLYSSKDLRELIGTKLSGALEKYVTVCQGNDGESLLKCRICPYETKDLHTFRAHTQKHENKKPYQCSTCGYRSNWSSDVHKHIRLKKSGHESAYVVKLNEAGFPHIKSMVISSRNRAHAMTINSALKVCLRCDFENDSRSDVIDHLNLVHNSPPYACRHCNFSSQYRKPCILHTQSQHKSLNSNIVENMICEYRRNASFPPSTGDRLVRSATGCVGDRRGSAPPNVIVAKNHDIQPFKRGAPNFEGDVSSFDSPPPAKSSRLDDYTSSFLAGSGREYVTANDGRRRRHSESVSGGSQASADDKFDTVETLCCDLCPFKCCVAEELCFHVRGHEKPKWLMSYKCVFCDWYSKKKLDIFHHLKLHTSDPFPFMAEVERNLITPLAQRAAADEHSDANALLGVSGMVKKYACSQCCFATDFARNMELHRACHGSVVGPYNQSGDNFCMRSSITSHSCYADGSTRSRLFSMIANAALPSLPVSPDAASSSCRSGSVPLSRDSGVYLDYNHVGDVISEFTAIIDAADQDLNKSSDASSALRTHDSGEHALNLKAVTSASKPNAETSSDPVDAFTATSLQNVDGSSGKEIDPDFNIEDYIHAGETSVAVDDTSESTSKDIQKISVVVNGEVKKMWQCRYCPHASKRRANIRMHEKKHFKANALGLMKCPKCNYRGERRSLNIHYRVHAAGVLPVSDCVACPSCAAVFRRQDYLNLHMLYHTGKFDFACSLCKYSVPSEQLLKKHMRVHESKVDSGTFQLPSEFASGSSETRRSPALLQYGSNETVASNGDDETAGSVISSLDTVTSSDEEESTGPRSPPDATVHEEEEAVDCTPTDLRQSCVVATSKNSEQGLEEQERPRDLSSPQNGAVADQCIPADTTEHSDNRRLPLKMYACSLCSYSVPFSIDLQKHLCTVHFIEEKQAIVMVEKADDGSFIEVMDYDEAPTVDNDGCVQPPANDRSMVSPSIVQNGGLKIKINLGKRVSNQDNIISNGSQL